MERGNQKLRILDRFIGIPAVVVLGKAQRLISSFRSDEFPRNPRKIGILAVAAIGDTVLADGMLADLKSAFPNAEVTIYTSKANGVIAPFLRGVDRHVEIPIQKPLAAIRLLRRDGLDWLIDTAPWPRVTSLVCIGSGASRTIGFSAPGQFRHYGYDFVVKLRHDIHQSQNLAALVLPLGIEVKSGPQLRNAASTRPVTGLPPRFVVFHAWPGGLRQTLKRWPEAHWAGLASKIAESNTAIVLTGGSEDREVSAKLALKLSDTGAAVIDLAGRTSLARTAWVLLNAAAVVSVDTGVLHLAASLGVPTIGIHGPTSSKRWGALGPQVTSIDAPGEDCGFLSLGFEHHPAPPQCMERISPGAVWQALCRYL